MLLFLTTNMAAVTSRANKQYLDHRWDTELAKRAHWRLRLEIRHLPLSSATARACLRINWIIFASIEFNPWSSFFFQDFITTFDWHCFLSSVATDGNDGHELKLEKAGPTFSSFNAMIAKITKVSAPCTKFVWYFLQNSTGGFCVWWKVLSNVVWFSPLE